MKIFCYPSAFCRLFVAEMLLTCAKLNSIPLKASGPLNDFMPALRMVVVLVGQCCRNVKSRSKRYSMAQYSHWPSHWLRCLVVRGFSMSSAGVVALPRVVISPVRTCHSPQETIAGHHRNPASAPTQQIFYPHSSKYFSRDLTLLIDLYPITVQNNPYLSHVQYMS